MFEITEKIRSGIALSIDSITLSEAEEIAGKAAASPASVYRYMREIKKGKRLYKNEDIVLELIKLAMEKKRHTSKKHSQIKDLEKQLSGIQ